MGGGRAGGFTAPRLASKMGHGQDYQYSHNVKGPDLQTFLSKKAAAYYQPKDSGFEAELSRRLKVLRQARQKDV